MEGEKLERREAEERELEEVRIFKKYNKLEQARMSDEAAIAAVQTEAEEREAADFLFKRGIHPHIPV